MKARVSFVNAPRERDDHQLVDRRSAHVGLRAIRSSVSGPPFASRNAACVSGPAIRSSQKEAAVAGSACARW